MKKGAMAWLRVSRMQRMVEKKMADQITNDKLNKFSFTSDCIPNDAPEVHSRLHYTQCGVGDTNLLDPEKFLPYGSWQVIRMVELQKKTAIS